MAYQGHGRGLPAAEVRDLSMWATDGLLPDLVVLLEVDRAEAQVRIGRGHATGWRPPVRSSTGPSPRASAARPRPIPQRWVTVDGGGTVAEVEARVRAVVAERLALPE